MNLISDLYKRRLLSFFLIILNSKNEIKRLIYKRIYYIKYLNNKIIKYLIR